MGKLIYTLNVSLDGFVESVDHGLDWGVVDEELHTWFNDLSRSLDAELYGRRIYELMAAHWPTAASDPAATEPMFLENTGHPVSNRLAVAHASKSHVHALGLSWDDTSGKNNGHFAPFTWRSA